MCYFKHKVIRKTFWVRLNLKSKAKAFAKNANQGMNQGMIYLNKLTLFVLGGGWTI